MKGLGNQMKNYVKEGQKLPLFGVGPYMISAMTIFTVIGIIIFCFLLKIGMLGDGWALIFRIVGTLFIITGLGIWYSGALRSGVVENIKDNRLKTDGIYGWVRNPMYSGVWILLSGVILMYHNYCLLIVIPVNWLIMTLTLVNTEEKWLENIYGDEYMEYKGRVNRCIPWIPGN